MPRSWVGSPDYRAAIEAIKAARTALNITQRELARRLGKPPSFVNKIELLERRIDVLEFIMVARALEIEPQILLRRVESALSSSMSPK